MKIFNKKISRTWLIIIIIVALVVGYYILKPVFKSPTADLITERAEKGEVSQEISETGSVQATDNISLSFKSIGKIQSIEVAVGDEVANGQILASIDVVQLSTQLKNAQASLDVARSQYDKLLNGYTPEDVKIYEDAVELARQDLNSAYASALNTLNDAYTKIYNSSNLVNDIQKSYFPSFDMNGIKVSESMIKIKDNMDKVKNYLDAAKANPSANNTDSAISQTIKSLEEVSSAIKIVRDVSDEWAYYYKISSADKASLDAQQTIINTALASATASQQSIASLKIALQRAENNLNLREAKPRQEDIEIYLAQIRQAEANVNLYQSQISDGYLRSPIDGVITKINAKAGEVISMNQPVINLLSLNPFQIKADIYEQDIVNVKIDDSVEVSIIAFPRQTLMGKVVSIDPAEKIVDQVVYYEVKIDFSNDIEGIRSGMTADIIIKTNKKENVLRVPKNAVENINGKDIVQVMNKRKIEDREITIGLEGNDYYEVLSGLNEGDEIITGKK